MSSNRGCLGAVFKLLGIKLNLETGDIGKVDHSIFPYAIRDDFLSSAELSFYKVLSQVVPKDEFIICPKVSLKDIFYVTEKDRSKHSTYLNKISRKHVDFLICHAETMKPICGIELDDATHNRKDRIVRDEFIEKLYETAGLKLVRIKAQRAYSLDTVKSLLPVSVRIKEKLSNNYSFMESDKKPQLEQSYPTETKIRYDETARNEVKEGEIPLCPKCNIPLVLRTANSGKNKGKAFYGCSNFPKCREISEID